jgi:hypothetical protein
LIALVASPLPDSARGPRADSRHHGGFRGSPLRRPLFEHAELCRVPSPSGRAPFTRRGIFDADAICFEIDPATRLCLAQHGSQSGVDQRSPLSSRPIPHRSRPSRPTVCGSIGGHGSRIAAGPCPQGFRRSSGCRSSGLGRSGGRRIACTHAMGASPPSPRRALGAGQMSAGLASRYPGRLVGAARRNPACWSSGRMPPLRQPMPVPDRTDR